jgi:hypothetical protein
VERCLACEAVVTGETSLLIARRRPSSIVYALGFRAAALGKRVSEYTSSVRAIQSADKGMHSGYRISLLTTASQARQRSTEALRHQFREQLFALFRHDRVLPLFGLERVDNPEKPQNKAAEP